MGRCCCGKYDIDKVFVSNGILHEPLGKSGAFCGPISSHKIRGLEKEGDRLLALAIKHCPKDHHDWKEILEFLKHSQV